MEYKGIYIIVRRDAETQRREAAPLGTDKNMKIKNFVS
jgi:hypothetical protein